MAIFIVDQFSLNTDLPLDIRYVPSGGSYNDVSAYWYPGMQVYQTSDQKIWYADNSLNWHQVGGAGDSSVNELYSLFADLSTYAHQQVEIINASIGRLDSSVNNIYSLIVTLDASIQDLRAWNLSQDASIEDLRGWQVSQDASIMDLQNKDLSQDASISELRSWELSQDASIVQLKTDISDVSLRVSLIESSVGAFQSWQVSQDASIIDLQNKDLSQDASISELRSWELSQDASIIDLQNKDTNIDISLNYLAGWNVSQDASIINLQNADIQIKSDVSVLWGWELSQDASISELRGWELSQDASIEDIRTNLETSLGLFVQKAGDTMTGPLTINAGGLQVDGDVSILSSGNLYVDGDAAIKGSLTINGSLYLVDVETIDVSSAFIHLNTGLTGTPPSILQSGIVIGRGDEEPYVFIFDESQQTFRIGIASETSTGYLDSSTQSVATREDTPTINGVAVWNNTLNRFDTYPALTFDGQVFNLDASLNLGNYAGGTDLMLVVQPDGYIRAVPTADGSINDLYSYIDGSLATRDSSITLLFGKISSIDASIVALQGWELSQDASISELRSWELSQDASISELRSWELSQDASIVNLQNADIQIKSDVSVLRGWELSQDASIIDLRTDIGNLDTSIQGLDSRLSIAETSISYLDSSIKQLFDRKDTSVLGAMNIGDGSAAVYAGITNDGSLQFRELVGVGAATVTQNGDLIEISIDASFAGEVNTASNIPGGDASIFSRKVGQDLQFKELISLDPSQLIITSDASFVYFDVSISAISEASLGGLTDVSLNAPLLTHQIIEFDADSSKWVNTDNIWWDTSLGTTTDDIGGVPAGTDLSGLTLKEILFRILYEYQLPLITVGSNPAEGIYEKGLVSTQFTTVDVSYFARNTNYPLAKLNNFQITKTGVGVLLDASLGLIDSCTGTYTDLTGITNWGGTSRTINYNAYIWDDQNNKGASVFDQASFTFYYRQYWGTVNGNTIPGQVNSAMILALDSSRLAGETDLNATFNNPGTGFIKYLFAYPDTVASPDNFGVLSEIIDQNGFDITDSFTTENEDVSVGVNNIRYRFYLLKNKVDTSTFNITFKF